MQAVRETVGRLGLCREEDCGDFEENRRFESAHPSFGSRQVSSMDAFSAQAGYCSYCSGDGGVSYPFAGRMSGLIQITNAEESGHGVATRLEVEVQAPGARWKTFASSSSRTASSSRCSLADQKAPRSSRTGPIALLVSREIGKRSGAGAAERHCDDRGHRGAKGPLRHRDGGIDGALRLAGSPRAAAGLGGVDTSHISAAPRWWCTRAPPEDVRRASVVGDVEYWVTPLPVLPSRARIADRAARGLLRAAARSGSDADRLFARGEAGNTARADFDYRVFPKPFQHAAAFPVDEKLLRSRRLGDPRRDDRGEAGGVTISRRFS